MTGAAADTLNKPGDTAPARTMRALTLVADRKIELAGDCGTAGAGGRRSADLHQGDRP